MADYSILDGKVLGGDQGEGVLLENILVKEGDRKGEEEAYIEIMGTAKTLLKDNFNPSAGWDELPEPVPVADKVRVVLADKTASNEILYERLNREFKFDPPLVDGPDTWERFMAGTKDSVRDQLVGNKAYFSARKNPSKTGEKLADYFFNLVNVSKRKEATMEDGGAAIKAILARKKAKAEAAPSFSMSES